MIGGLVTVIVLIVIKVPEVVKTAPVPLPDTIVLPDGSQATNFTRGPDWYGVVTRDNRILIFNINDGQLRQTIRIKPR